MALDIIKIIQNGLWNKGRHYNVQPSTQINLQEIVFGCSSKLTGNITRVPTSVAEVGWPNSPWGSLSKSTGGGIDDDIVGGILVGLHNLLGPDMEGWLPCNKLPCGSFFEIEAEAHVGLYPSHTNYPVCTYVGLVIIKFVVKDCF